MPPSVVRAVTLIVTPQSEITSAAAPPKTRRSIIVAALLLITVVTLAFGEVVLRFAGMGAKRRDIFADSVLGFVVPPNVKSRTENPEHPSKVFYFPYNNYGFLETEDTPRLPVPGVHRIAIVGDSHTQGFCPPEETFTNRLEQRLNKITGERRFEVLNAGAGRYAPYQYYIKAKTVIAPLKPEHLIVGLYIGNDLSDLLRQDDRPYLEVQRDGSMVHRNPIFIVHKDPNAHSLLENSRIYNVAAGAIDNTIGYQVTRARLLMHNISSAGYGWRDVVDYMISVKKLTDLSRGMMTQVLHQYHWFEHFPKTQATALRLNREVMRLFKQLGDDRGIRITYVLIPSKADIEPEDLGEKWDAIAGYNPAITREKVLSFNRMFIDETRKAAADLGVEAIDLRPELLARKKPGLRLYYREDMHLNPQGHAVVADILAAALRGRFPESAVKSDGR
jgi:hypothetical protein